MGKHKVPVNEYRKFYDVFARKFIHEVTGRHKPPKGNSFWKDNAERALEIFGDGSRNPEYLYDVLYRIKPTDTEISVEIPALKGALEYLGLEIPKMYRNKYLEPKQTVEILWDEFKVKFIDQNEGKKKDKEPVFYKEIFDRIYWFYKWLEAGEAEKLHENLLSPNFRYRLLIKENVEKYKDVFLFGMKVEFAGGMVYKELRSDLVEAEVILGRYVETKLEEKLITKPSEILEPVSIAKYKKELLFRLHHFTFVCINNYWFIEDIGPYKRLRGESIYTLMH